MSCSSISDYGVEVVLVIMSWDGVLLVRRGEPGDPLPRRGALCSSSNRWVAVLRIRIRYFFDP